MTDPLQFGLNVRRGCNVPVGKATEVELDPGLEAPLQRHLVDAQRPFAAVHGRGEVVGRIKVRAIVGGDIDALDRPAFAVGKIAGRKTGKEGADRRRALLVIDVGDLGLVAGRIGGDVALQRYGNVDDAASQGAPSLVVGDAAEQSCMASPVAGVMGAGSTWRKERPTPSSSGHRSPRRTRRSRPTTRRARPPPNWCLGSGWATWSSP